MNKREQDLCAVIVLGATVFVLVAGVLIIDLYSLNDIWN